MKALFLVSLIVVLSPLFASAEESLNVGSQELATMDVDAVMEDARTEELRFHKKTTSADLKSLDRESAKIERKLKIAQENNQKLETELTTLQSTLDKKQAVVEKQRLLLAQAQKKSAALESRKSRVLKNIKATEIRKHSDPKKALAIKKSALPTPPVPTHAKNSEGRARL